MKVPSYLCNLVDCYDFFSCSFSPVGKPPGLEAVIVIITIWSWSPRWLVYSHKTVGYMVMEAAESIGDLSLSKSGHQWALQ